ncbi:MAG: hypothetical protein ACRDG9_13740 [Actinomycetota bacterium]
MTQRDTAMACATCESSIDRCEFGEESVCRSPICYQCLAEALGQAMALLHAHGG